MSFSGAMPLSLSPPPSHQSDKSSRPTLYFHQNGQGRPTLKDDELKVAHVPPQVTCIKKPKPPQQNLRSKEMVRDREAIRQHRNELQRLIRLIQDLENGEDTAGGDVLELQRNTQIRLAHESKLDDLRKQLSVYEGLKIRTVSNLPDLGPYLVSAQLQRELYRFQSQLPIFSKRIEIEAHLENDDCRFLIIQGQTGSGKSTQLPQYFADHPKFVRQKILCTQPRKIAAISLARRVAFEYACGERSAQILGNEIGYRVAGQKVVSGRTRIEFITEGKMLEHIISGKADPFQNVGVIILDEAHERSLTCDLLLGCFKSSDPRWDHIKIVITSATIDLDQFSTFFNQAPTVLVEGRTFPVSLSYIPTPGFGVGDNTIGIVKGVVSTALEIHLTQGHIPGDILCFLPGQADVLSATAMFEKEWNVKLQQLTHKRQGQPHKKQQAQESQKLDKSLEQASGDGGDESQGQGQEGHKGASHHENNPSFLDPCVLPLYGRLEPEQQQRIFESLGNSVRKIIFTTDIAETSVTIDGIVHVVDSGVKKGIVYDGKRKITSLQIQQISKSNAIQRMGRAGRTQPGECYRLYRPEDFDTMEFGTNPEVLQRPLALAVLTLRKLRMDPTTFSWISQPSIEALKSAEEELLLLGALTLAKGDGEPTQDLTLTDLGHMISTVQQEPNLVKMIHCGAKLGFGSAAVALASIFPVSNIFYWHGSGEATKGIGNKKKRDFSLPEGDIVSLYRVFEEWNRISNSGRATKAVGTWCQENFVNGKAMRIILSSIAELKSYFRGTESWKRVAQDGKPTNDELCRITFSGFFLNTAHVVSTKNARGNLQYFSLHTGILGNCSRGSALTHRPNPPEWIVYERVLQVPITLFLSCNQIKPEWIQAENPEFYESCLEKRNQLPTTLTKCLSAEIISTLLGKFYSNVQLLQNELDSAIESDVDAGRLTLYCPRNRVKDVERLLEQKIRGALVHLEEKVTEVDYLGGCRLLIGQGYNIKDVLFSDDFVTVYIRNLAVGIQEEDLRNSVLSLLPKSKDTRIRQIVIFRGSGSGTGLITFHSKDTAQEFHQGCSRNGVFIQGKKLETNPSLGKRKGMSVEITGKLKFSWSTAQSKQEAKIWFKTGEEANRFIDNAGSFLSGAAIRAVGVKADPSGKKIHTPTRKVDIGRASGTAAGRYRFDLDQIRLMRPTDQAILEYSVSVKSIPISMDEYEIKEALRYFKVEHVRVERQTPNVSEPEDNWRAEESKPPEEDLSKNLLPVEKWLKTVPNSNFDDKGGRRRGVLLNFTRIGLLREAYSEIVNSAHWRDMGKSFGQNKRLEIEYFYTATIMRELYHIFRAEIRSISDYAISLKIRVMDTEQKREKGQAQLKSKFVYIKFQSHSQAHFPEIQKRMEEVIACTKYESDHIHLLFTWTGKAALVAFKYFQYMFTSVHSQGVWVYGSADLRATIVGLLNGIVDHLKSLDFLDFKFPLNKKVIRSNLERDILQREYLRKAKSLELATITGPNVMVSGRSADVEKLERILKEKQFIFNHYKQKSPQGTELEECGLCFSPPENGKYVITTGCKNQVKDCGRIFCLECIQPMFEQAPPTFPLRCPTCETELVINDILKWALPGSLRKVMEVAVGDYRDKNSDRIIPCPKPGCEQILTLSSVTKGVHGGEFVFCDECMTTYCLPCSAKMGKPELMHEDDSCAEIQSGSSNRVRIHVKAIQESILNLQCPRCKSAFDKFDGCAALSCAKPSCGCAFCALCLEDCGNDAHDHVRTCKWNKGKGFFVNSQTLDKVHKTIRIEKIKKYFGDVTYEEQEAILKIMCKDLMDLGITAANVKVHERSSNPTQDDTIHENDNQDQRPAQDRVQPEIVPQPPPDRVHPFNDLPNRVPPPVPFQPPHERRIQFDADAERRLLLEVLNGERDLRWNRLQPVQENRPQPQNDRIRIQPPLANPGQPQLEIRAIHGVRRQPVQDNRPEPQNDRNRMQPQFANPAQPQGRIPGIHRRQPEPRRPNGRRRDDRCTLL